MRIAALLLGLFLQDDSPDWDALQRRVEALASDDPLERAAARHELTITRPSFLRGIKDGLAAEGTYFVAACSAALMGDAKCQNLLLVLATKGPATQRIAAFEALQGLEPDAEVCIRSIEKDEPRVALAAGRALFSRKDPGRTAATLTALAAAIDPGDTSLPIARVQRLLVIRAVLGQFRQTTPPPAADFLAHRSPDVAELAIFALLQLDPTLIRSRTAAALRTARARQDLDARAAEEAALVLLRSRTASTEDIVALVDASPEVRGALRKALSPDPPDGFAVSRWMDLVQAGWPLAAEFREILAPWATRHARLPEPGPDDGSRAALLAWLKIKHAEWPDPFELEADEAGRRGAEWLGTAVANAAARGRHRKELALIGYALVMGGFRPDAQPLHGVLEDLVDSAAEPEGTYQAALRAMTFAEALKALPPEGARKDARRERFRWGLEKSAQFLVSTQLCDGSWTYTREGAEQNRVWGGGDLSNSQFAVLGLRAAANEGVKIADDVWTKAEKHWTTTGGGLGTWNYSGDESHSMTAAGITSLLIARSTLQRRPAAELLDTERIAAALEWLGKNPPKQPDLYWLWSLERCGMTVGSDTIGGHRWYAEGATLLLNTQTKSGSWTSPKWNAEISTSFAVLFLRRAYVPVATIGGERKDKPEDVVTGSAEPKREKR